MSRRPYIAQVRRRGARKWRTVPGTHSNKQRAMCRAVMAMEDGDVAARVLVYATWSGAYSVMEARAI